jgi:hypothetical protein
MKSFVFTFFVFCAGALFAASPREIADLALEAWDSHDASRLYPLSHPELIARIKTSRLLIFHVDQKSARRDAIRSGSDKQIVELFCEALSLVVPNTQFKKSRDFIRTAEAGDVCSVFFTQVTRHLDGRAAAPPYEVRIVLKRYEKEWRLLWLPSAQIHIDLTWEPENEK